MAGIPTPGGGYNPNDTENLPPSGYPELAIAPVAPASGQEGYSNALRVQGTLRQSCPMWESPALGQKTEGDKKYRTWRNRFLLWAEGELLLQVPPGLISRDLVQAISGPAHDCLIEVPRPVLYRPRENHLDGTARVKSGLEILLLVLDWGWGREIEDEEENVVEELDAHWRTEGMDMATYRMTFWRMKKRAEKEAKLGWSESYTSKRLINRARITPTEKSNLLFRVDSDWTRLGDLDHLLPKNCPYKGDKSRKVWYGIMGDPLAHLQNDPLRSYYGGIPEDEEEWETSSAWHGGEASTIAPSDSVSQIYYDVTPPSSPGGTGNWWWPDSSPSSPTAPDLCWDDATGAYWSNSLQVYMSQVDGEDWGADEEEWANSPEWWDAEEWPADAQQPLPSSEPGVAMNQSILWGTSGSEAIYKGGKKGKSKGKGKGKGKSKGKKGKKSGASWKGHPGHPPPTASGTSNRIDPRTGAPSLCSICGSPKHWARDCDQPGKGGSKAGSSGGYRGKGARESRARREGKKVDHAALHRPRPHHPWNEFP